MHVPAAGLSRRAVLMAGLLTGAGAVGGCAARPAGEAPSRRQTTGSGTVSTAPDGAQTITLTEADDYVFVPDRFTVTAGKVRLTLTSTAKQLTHNI